MTPTTDDTAPRKAPATNRGWERRGLQLKPKDWTELERIAAQVGSPNWRNLITRIARGELCVSTIKGE